MTTTEPNRRSVHERGEFMAALAFANGKNYRVYRAPGYSRALDVIDDEERLVLRAGATFVGHFLKDYLQGPPLPKGTRIRPR